MSLRVDGNPIHVGGRPRQTGGVRWDTGKDITGRLRSILSNWLETQESAEVGGPDFEFQSATPDEVFDYLDNELGLS